VAAPDFRIEALRVTADLTASSIERRGRSLMTS